MVTDLLLPKRGIVVPKPPSYIKLDMAFALGEGTILGDKSRYRSHGTISGALWADGAHGRCLDFNAANPDYVVIRAAHTQLDFTAEDFSLVARVRTDDATIGQYIFVRGSRDSDGYEFLIESNMSLRFWTNQAGANQRTYTGAAEIAAGIWYTIGFSRNGADVRLYKNGVDITTGPAVHINPLTCARSAKIGVTDGLLWTGLDGRIEFLRIFGGVALSASEHLAWHNALA